MESKYLSQVIKDRLISSGKRFWAGDNISEFISEEEIKRFDGKLLCFKNINTREDKEYLKKLFL